MCFEGIYLLAFTVMVASSKALLVNQGREFVLAFPLHYSQYAFPKVLITKITQEVTNVTVSAPLDTGLLASTSYMLGASNVTVLLINFTNDFVLNKSDVSTRALHVVSDYDVVVSGISYFIVTNYFSFGAYLAFPVSGWSSTYLTVTACQENECFIVITCAKPNVTVQAKLTLMSYANATGITPSLTFGNKTYKSGQTITQSLNAFQTMQLLAVQVDMSGTIIESTGNIAVFSGGAFTLFDSTKLTNDHAIEQIPPLSSLGTIYVVTAFPKVTLPTIVKVTYTDVNTSLTFNTTVMNFLRKSSYFAEFNLTIEQSTVVYADRPVLITLFTRCGNGARFDPSAVTLNPVSSWTTTYMAVVTDMNNEVFYFSIATFANCSCAFNLNGQPLSLNWTTLPSATYKTTSYLLAALGQNVIQNTGCVFGGYVIGATYYLALALPLAAVNLTTSQCLALSSSPSAMSSSLTTFDVKTSQALLTLEITLGSSSLHITSGTDYLAITRETLFGSTGLITDAPGDTSHDISSGYTTYVSISSEMSSILNSTPSSSSISEIIQTSETTLAPPYQFNMTFSGSEIFLLPTTDMTPTFTPVDLVTPNTVIASTLSELVNTGITSTEGFTMTSHNVGMLNQCPCACNARFLLTPENSRDVTKRALRDQTLRDLSLMTANLSSSLRRKISSENLTTSSRYLGGFTSIPVFCAACCFMMLSDVCCLVKCLLVFVREKFSRDSSKIAGSK